MSSVPSLVVLFFSCLFFFSPFVSAHKHGKWGSSHGELSNERLTAIYNERVECQRCVRDNNYFNGLNGNSTGFFTPPTYSPQMVLQWCPSSYTYNTDYEGSCMDINSNCPTRGIQDSLLCHLDDPSTKLTCSQCVMDSYAWTFSHFAARHNDEYNGTCSNISSIDLTTVGEWVEVNDDDEYKTVVELKDCIKLTTPKMRGLKAAMATNMFLVLYFWATLLVASGCGIRACLQRRALAKARAAAILNSSNQTTQGSIASTGQLDQPFLSSASQVPVSYSQPATHIAAAAPTTYYQPQSQPHQAQIQSSNSNYVAAAVPYTMTAYPVLSSPSIPTYSQY